MRLTLVIHSLDCGGAQRVLTALANWWTRAGHTVTILALCDSRRPSFFPLDARVSVEWLDVMRGSRHVLAALANNFVRVRTLRAALRRSRPDLVLSFLATVNVLVLLAAAGRGVPVIVSERSNPKLAPLPCAWRRLRRWLYPQADAVVVQTRRGADWFPAGLQSRIVVIPNATGHPGAAAPGGGEPSGRRMVLGVGRLGHEKGFDLLVRAFAQAARNRPDWELVVAGEGPEKARLTALAEASGVAGRLRLPGRRTDIWPLYHAAHIFVLPSRFEGFPNALLEAMAAGLPALAADCATGPREIIRDGHDGLLVPAEDAAALAEALARLMGDADLRSRLGAAATAVVDRFGADTIQARWDTLVADVAGPGGAADMFDHLHIQDRCERWLVGCADAAVAPLAAIRAWRRPPASDTPPQRVLLLRLERIGDLLMTLEAIAAVRQGAPAAEIHLAVGSWNADLARLLPGVDCIDILDAPWLSQEGTRSSPREAAALIGRWRRLRVDLAINFEPDIRSNALLAASGAPRRFGYFTGGGGGFLTAALRHDPTVHTAANALRLVRHALPSAAPPEHASTGPALNVPPDADARAGRRLAVRDGHGPLVGINPGAGRPVKEWPAERFAAAASALAAHDDATIVLLGSPAERKTADAVEHALPERVRRIDLAGDLPLVELAAVLGRLSLLLTVDTGPMHLAAAVGTPVVGIFGPSDPVRYAPRSPRSEVVHADLWCRPCNRMRRPPRRCADSTPDCLAGIGVGAVVDAARRLLREP